MSQQVFREENGYYEIVFPEGTACIQLDKFYKGSNLKSVDIIVDTDEKTILMEYKNSTIPNAANPNSFCEKLKGESHSIDIARKYYDSLLYVLSKQLPGKTLHYHYVVEAHFLDSVTRKWLAEKIINHLPFKLQKRIEATLITDFTVDTISDWNKRYPNFALEYSEPRSSG